VGVEDVVDNTLKLICDVCVFEFFHFLLIARFKFERMGYNLTVHVLLILVVRMK